MPITAAEVESNGWVLRVTVTGSPTVPNTNFTSYALDPNGAPRVVLSTSHAGFQKSGGIAVPGSLARSLVATLPLRLPVNPASPTVKVLDETDLGGGVIRVRLALSEHVYATDTALSLTTLAGWRAGEAAQAGLAVANNSTLAAPLPIMRWALAPYDVTSGSFRVSLFVVSHHPQGFEPVAGVRFTVTDGTTVKAVWVTALDTDNSLGDNLRCYTAIIDPAATPALSAGLLRIDAEVYPWLGAMRTTDAAGTRSMASIRTIGLAAAAASPWVTGYDPAGTRYGDQFVLVDTGGTTTASAAMVATTLAGAKAVALGSRAANIAVAKQALYLANKTIAAANGQAAITRAGDGARIVLAAGQVHGVSTASVTSGFQTPEIPLRITGDPDNENPRGNCLLRSGAANPGSQRNTRDRFQNLTLETGGFQITLVNTVFIDNCDVRARAGQESSSIGIFGSAPAAGFANFVVTRTRWWRSALAIGASGAPRCLLIRATEASRTMAALALFRNRWIGNAEDGIVLASDASTQVTGWGAPTLASQGEDWIAAFNDLRHARAFSFSPVHVPAAAAGTLNPSMRRWAFVSNVVERTGALPQPFFATGEGSSQTNSYNVIEGNTFVGDRSNTFYNDPVPSTLTDVNTQINQAFANRVANNACDWWPTKHDDFNDGEAQVIRIANGQAGLGGYRPQLVDAWSSLFGVGFEGNYDTARSASSNFEFMWPGLRSVQNLSGAVVAPLYTSDGSIAGPGGAGATGGGNYLPQAGSPLLGRVTSGNSDRDFAGNARISGGAAGAFEASATGVGLTPAGCRSGHVGGSPDVLIAFALVPGPARHSHFADATNCGWQVTLTAAPARSEIRAGAAAIMAATGGDLLQPESALHQLPSGVVIILPDSGGAGLNTLTVAFDLRTLSIR